MFYKLLFLLSIYSLYRNLRSFIRESVVTKDDKIALASASDYIPAVLILVFHLMVMAICSVPSILF